MHAKECTSGLSASYTMVIACSAEVELACHILLVCNRGSSGIAARESDHTNQYMWKFHSSC